MELIGYICLLCMGFTLGLIGAGGSLLTIPILIYLFHTPIVLVPTYSFVIVGSCAFVATIRYRKNIAFKKSAIFSLPSVVGVFCARVYIWPRLPLSWGLLSREKALVLLLTIFMAAAGFLMIRDVPPFAKGRATQSRMQPFRLVFLGFFLGILLGILGAGGGFLIIPTLIVLMGFSMQHAIATSLFIITINSFMGFLSDQHHLFYRDWMMIRIYLTLALGGMFLGMYFSRHIPRVGLKKGFGWFVCALALLILFREFAPYLFDGTHTI